jgi:hypothetical protein
MDAQKKRFLFVYYGNRLDILFFQGKFRLSSVEGTSDDRGCHFVFVKTVMQIRTSQFEAAIRDYNLTVSGNMVMRFQEEQPAIVTMRSRRLEGSIYSKIAHDKKVKCDGGSSNYWCWDPVLEEDAFEFDVVKKRRAIDTAAALGPASPSADDSAAALAAFEDFESSVLPALERIKADEDNHRHLELLQLEDDVAKGTPIVAAGGVYFAWSPCLQCTKIGATRRDTPGPRLRELSRHVTAPFALTGWIPTPTPFRLESVAHAHFAARRIREAGAGTEFFRIGGGGGGGVLPGG